MRGFKRFLLLTTVLLSSCSTHFFDTNSVQKKGKNQLRLVTYNINWGESNWPITAPQNTSNAIRRIDGDIVLLQEATPYWQTYLKEHLSTLYPYQLFKHMGNGGGLAVLSKFPVADQSYTHSSIGWHPGWIIDVNSPYGTIQVANLHLTPPLVSKNNLNFALGVYFSTPEVREKEIEYYYQFIHRSRPTIIGGDFNEGSNGFVTQFLTQHGFNDARCDQGQNDSTWSWTLGFITLHQKLDHIFYNEYFRVVKVFVLKQGDSDHFPLAADLQRVD